MVHDGSGLDPERIPRPLSYPLEQRREKTLDTLQRAYVEGILTSEEFDERMELAGTARNDAELVVLVDDIPGAKPVAKPPEPSTALVPVPGNAMVPTSSATREVGTTILAILGDVKRRGAWHVHPTMQAIAVLGSARLDLTEAHLPPQTEIQCMAFMGEIRIDVPKGVRVESSGAALLGDFRSHEDASTQPDAPVIRITGFALLATVDVRVKK
jgi:hypothetical protein